MKKKPSKFSHLFENNQFNVVISIVAAVIAWLLVSLYVNTEDTVTIKNIPVDLDYSSSVYQALDLSIVDTPEYTVSVRVSGPRSVINGLSASDILVYPQMSGVTDAGRYDLSLTAVKADNSKDFEIVAGSISPRTVSIRFDHVVTKKFVVEVDATGVQPAEGYILDKAFTTPGELTLSGPESEVNAVSRVVAEVDLTGQVLTESQLVTGTIKLYDRDNNPLSQNLITFDVDTVEVTVPILKKATLPLAVELTGIPDGLDTSIFKYTLSVDSINVAGPGSRVDELEKLTVGYLNIAREFKLDGSYEFDITLDSGFVNLDNITKVTMNFDTSGLASKTVEVTDIRAVNAPSGYDIQVETAAIHDVTLIGTPEELATISAEDVVGQIDASDISAESGQQTVSVQMKIPGTTTVFAAGSYTALIQVSAQ